MSDHKLKNRYETVIIGAGPAGLAAAIELTKAKRDFCIIEKQSQVGGLAKTYTITEDGLIFRTDNGPHRFFSKNQYLYDFIADVLKDDWIKVRRQTRQLINGSFYDYPINAVQALKNIGIFRASLMIFDYVIAFIRYRVFRKPIRNFYDFAVANFGKRLAYFNIINYTEKIWGISAKELHMNWAQQRISGLNFRSALANALKTAFGKRGGSGPKTLIDTFYYPRNGTGTIYENIANEIVKRGAPLLLESSPTRIRHDGERIQSVTITTDGAEHELSLDYLVESVHITDFVKLLDPAPPVAVLDAAKRLRYRSQVYLFLTLNRERVTDDQWIYIPDASNPIARWSEMKNFSDRLSPPGKTSLFIEFFCNESDPIHRMTADELYAYAMPYFKKLNLFSPDDVRHWYLFKGGKDYPIYDIGYEDNIAVVKKYLDGFRNLHYIGRPGRFKYTNQDHSLEMGILAAKSIIEGRKFDIENVGAETEYFERGYVPITKQ